MKLDQYLFDHNMTKKQFAAKIGYTPQYVCLIAKGRLKPGIRAAKLIARETGGLVNYNELRQSQKCECCGQEVPAHLYQHQKHQGEGVPAVPDSKPWEKSNFKEAFDLINKRIFSEHIEQPYINGLIAARDHLYEALIQDWKEQ